MAINENSSNFSPAKLAKGLGWFSVGLGLAELLAPGIMARLTGFPDNGGTRTLLRTYGLRELGAGVGILSAAQPAGWVKARVAGDVLDVASLIAALGSGSSDKTRLAISTAAVLGVAALDILCGQNLTSGSRPASGAKWKPMEGPITETIFINRSPETVYQAWRNIENFPSFMEHLESVRVTGENRSHWKATGPAGTTFEWDAEIVQDQPNRLIAWHSVENADIQNSGKVGFSPGPGGRGTFVSVDLQYAPPGGKAAATIAKLFGKEPSQQLYDDLRRFKQIVETGEVLKSAASIHKGMHSAQPEAQPELEPSMA
jgi:uncharacterized membrane protein